METTALLLADSFSCVENTILPQSTVGARNNHLPGVTDCDTDAQRTNWYVTICAEMIRV